MRGRRPTLAARDSDGRRSVRVRATRKRGADEAPAQTLLDLIDLAAATQRMAMRERANNPVKADGLVSSSARIQLAAAGLLHAIGALKDNLGRYECDELLGSPMGQASLLVALKNKGRIYLTQVRTPLTFACRERARW